VTAPTQGEWDAWLAHLERAVASLQEIHPRIQPEPFKPPHKAFADPFDDRFWIKRANHGLRGWGVSVPTSWEPEPGVTERYYVIAPRFEDAVALVALGVDCGQTTYLAVVGQLHAAGEIAMPNVAAS